MSILLVLCDSNDAKRLEAACAEYGETFRLSGSTYLLHARQHHDDVLSNLRRTPRLVCPDSLFVIPLQQRHIGRTTSEVNSWLRRMAEKDLE